MSAQPVSAAAVSAIRLLILDDDPLVGQTIANIAEAIGVGTNCFAEPHGFLEAAGAWAPTHIALDLVMPAMDGIEVLAELARRHCTASILLISGMDTRVLDAAARSATEYGLHLAGVLHKPFSPPKLRSLLALTDTRAAVLPEPEKTAADLPALQDVLTAARLRAAIADGELVTYYQPKVRCATGELAGYEALVRWVHPEYGVLMPDSFIPLAEAGGLMDALTSQVLEESLGWFAGTLSGQAADKPLTISVNISAHNLADEKFVEELLSRCRSQGVEPRFVVIELTETCAMENPARSLATLTRLRMKGFLLAIDDLGTGFSSLLQLVRLPFSEVKIDKSFVMKASSSEESRKVVKSIVDLGHSLGLLVTAEGVDDGDTLDFLRETGCDLAQGYLIGKPAPGPRAIGSAGLPRRSELNGSTLCAEFLSAVKTSESAVRE